MFFCFVVVFNLIAFMYSVILLVKKQFSCVAPLQMLAGKNLLDYQPGKSSPQSFPFGEK